MKKYALAILMSTSILTAAAPVDMRETATAFVGVKLAQFGPTTAYDTNILKLALGMPQFSEQARAFISEKIASFDPSMAYDADILNLALELHIN